MAVYLGFNESQMLRHLARECPSMTLCVIPGEDLAPQFALKPGVDAMGTVYRGSLFHVLVKASKPYIEKWKKEREHNRAAFEDFLTNGEPPKAAGQGEQAV